MKAGKLQRSGLLFWFWCWTVPSRDTDPAHDSKSKMADDCDFLAGEDLDAILDMLEADEGVEEEFNIEVENVSTKNGLIVPVFNNKRPKMASLNSDRRVEMLWNSRRQTLRQICSFATTIVIWMYKNYILWIWFYLGSKAGDYVQEMRQEVQD